MQSETTDSGMWWRVELGRAAVRQRLGDRREPRHTAERVRGWCATHPGNDVLRAFAAHAEGCADRADGRLDDALLNFERAENLLVGKGLPRRLINTRINLADTYYFLGRYPDAARCYHEARHLADSLQRSADLATIHAGLANIYIALTNFPQADYHLKLAGQLTDVMLPTDRFYFYNTLGNCRFFEKRYADAAAAFRRAWAEAMMHKDSFNIFCSEANLGEVFLNMGRTDSASGYLERCSGYLERNPDMNPAAAFYVRSLLVDLRLRQGRTAEARRIMPADSLARIAAGGVPRYRSLHLDRMRRFAEQSGDYKSAYRLLLKVNAYEDSLQSLTIRNNIAEMQSRYRRDSTLMMQRAILADYAAKDSIRAARGMMWLGGFMVVILLFALAFFIHFRRGERRYRRLAEQIMRLRVSVVLNRLSPHFIFNALCSIVPKFRAYPELERPTERLIGIIRRNLMMQRSMSVDLNGEMEGVKQYVEFYQSTHEGLPRVEWHVAPDADLNVSVPTMCIQILVENALKHAFDSLTLQSCIVVSVLIEEDGTTVLSVEDNGNGYHPTAVPSNGRDTGTGLRLLSSSVDLLNGRNPKPASFTIANRPAPKSGTIGTLRIPRGYSWTF